MPSHTVSKPDTKRPTSVTPAWQDLTKPGLPRRFGLLLYPGFEVLDVFGPIEALNVISRPDFKQVTDPPEGYPGYLENASLSVIAEKPGPVSPASGQGLGAAVAQQILPQYAIGSGNIPPLDVLIIPGGLGTFGAMGSDVTMNWIKEVLPSLKYVITVCTGAWILAKTGALNGLKATTNKQAWSVLTEPSSTWAQSTYWVAHARWVVSSSSPPPSSTTPSIWTTSGVSAGTDGFLAWIAATYGSDVASKCCDWMEYNFDPDVTKSDNFSHGLSDVKPVKTGE